MNMTGIKPIDQAADLKQYALIQDIGEILSRPNFVEKASVNFASDDGIKLDNIIGQYQFRDKVKCGIASCGTKHAKGYIASLSNGQEIMMGHVCGKNNFGVDFTNKEKEFRALRIHADQFHALKAAYEQLEASRQVFEHTLQHTGKLSFVEIKNGIHGLVGGGLSYWITQTIKNKVSSLGMIFEEVHKTDEEKAIERHMKGDESSDTQRYVRDTKNILVAEIENFDVVYQWHEAEKLKDYFEKIHREIRNPVGMPDDVFKKLVKRMKDYDQNLQELRRFCVRGNKLLKKDNLIKLTCLFRHSDEIRAIEQFARKYG
jgi:hypothetical protein